jgi:hypothetical protein
MKGLEPVAINSRSYSGLDFDPRAHRVDDALTCGPLCMTFVPREA